MLSQPKFDDRALNQSLYQTLVDRFYDTLNLSTQTQLAECSFGFAPSPTGIQTFMIVAPSLVVAEQLLQELEHIIERIQSLMAGVGQVAICIAPQQDPYLSKTSVSQSCNSSKGTHPSYMMCKIFPVSHETEDLDS